MDKAKMTQPITAIIIIIKCTD